MIARLAPAAKENNYNVREGFARSRGWHPQGRRITIMCGKASHIAAKAKQQTSGQNASSSIYLL